MAELRAEGWPTYRTPPGTACIRYDRRETPAYVDVPYSIPGQPAELPCVDVTEAYLKYFSYDPEAVTIDPQTNLKTVQRVYSLLDAEFVLIHKVSQNHYVALRP